MAMSEAAPRTYLFLQGPISAFFPRIAARIEALAPSARILRINLCFGDALFWRRPGAVNYRGTLADWPAFIEDFIAREGVTDVVLLGEQRDYHKHASAAAKAHGATVVATDFGYLRPDWIAFELDGLSGASRFPKEPGAIRALAARSPEPDLEPRYWDHFWRRTWLDIAYHIGTMLFWFTHPHYTSHQPDHPMLTYLGTGLRLLLQGPRARAATAEIEAAEQRTTQTFLFPLQIARDFSLRAYSPFSDLDGPIDNVIASFARHARKDATLVLKVHPLDPGLRNWRKVIRRSAERHGAAGRVIYIDGGDLSRMIEASAGVVVVNSTVGMLSLQLGAPTVALGQAIYDVPGMTARGGLDAFWQAPPKPDAELVQAFVRALAGAVMVRGTFYNEPGLSAAVEAAAARLTENAVNQPRMAAE